MLGGGAAARALGHKVSRNDLKAVAGHGSGVRIASESREGRRRGLQPSEVRERVQSKPQRAKPGIYRMLGVRVAAAESFNFF